MSDIKILTNGYADSVYVSGPVVKEITSSDGSVSVFVDGPTVDLKVKSGGSSYSFIHEETNSGSARLNLGSYDYKTCNSIVLRTGENEQDTNFNQICMTYGKTYFNNGTTVKFYSDNDVSAVIKGSGPWVDSSSNDASLILGCGMWDDITTSIKITNGWELGSITLSIGDETCTLESGDLRKLREILDAHS